MKIEYIIAAAVAWWILSRNTPSGGVPVDEAAPNQKTAIDLARQTKSTPAPRVASGLTGSRVVEVVRPMLTHLDHVDVRQIAIGGEQSMMLAATPTGRQCLGGWC